MVNKEKLPWDLVAEILSRVPPKPLVRFRTVCKRWNTLFDDKAFINNHKMTFQFILVSKSKIYSISLNPEIKVCELNVDIPGLKYEIPKDLVDCNGFLLCGLDERAVVCNPWLGQTRCIQTEVNQPSLHFLGIGYDTNRRAEEIVYKTLASYQKDIGSTHTWKIYDFASDAWKDQELEETKHGPLGSRSSFTLRFHTTRGVSLNGTLYWVAYNEAHPSFVLVSFDFSSEQYMIFCDLPFVKNDYNDALFLRIFRGDRFSLLNQCHVTKKIKIWVTKNKIGSWYGRNVKWMNFMEMSIPNLPDVLPTEFYPEPSYFIDDKRGDKRLVVCSCDVNGRAWIYVVGENKLISKIRLHSVVDPWPLHCSYSPSLVLLPGCRREEKAELQVNFSFVWLFVRLFRKLKLIFW